MGDSEKYSFKLCTKRKYADLIIDENLSALDFLSEVDRSVDDLSDPDYIQETYLEGDNLEQIADLLRKIKRISSPTKRQFNIFFPEHERSTELLFPCIAAQLEALANDNEVNLPRDYEFDDYEDSSSDESEEEIDVFCEPVKHEEVEKKESFTRTFALPSELQKPKISAAEFEKLIDFVPVRKNVIIFDRRSDENTERNFKTVEKLVPRANYTPFYHDIVLQGDKGHISTITVTDFEEK